MKYSQLSQGTNPLAMWKAFQTTLAVRELADFALLLLGMSVNQAGLEHNFLDLKIKKTRLRNHLKLPRLEKMAKVSIIMQNSPVLVTSYPTRLAPTFICHRRKPVLLKSVQNRRIMMTAS
jgi:hypothetical protein